MRSDKFNRDTEECRWHQTLKLYIVPTQIRNNIPTITAQTSHVYLIRGQSTHLAVVHIDVGLYYDVLSCILSQRISTWGRGVHHISGLRSLVIVGRL